MSKTAPFVRPNTGTKVKLAARIPLRRKVILVVEQYLNADDHQPLIDLSRFMAPAGVELSLIHAVSDIITGLHGKADDAVFVSNTIREREKRQAEVRVQWRQALETAGFHLAHEQTCTMQDQNARQIIEYAQENAQDLLVVYTARDLSVDPHEEGLATRNSHFGLMLATHATLPVLMLRRAPGAPTGRLKLLFGVDPSEATMTAARKLPDLIRADAVDLTLATVQSPIYQENVVLAPYVNQDVLEAALDANAEMTFAMVRELLETRGLSAQNTLTRNGSPATELGFVAETEHPDLIVLGSHNRKGFLAWLTGSVSSQLLHWDTHNILIIR
jgi:nucleotide-binding universal stress UspA family protein